MEPTDAERAASRGALRLESEGEGDRALHPSPLPNPLPQGERGAPLRRGGREGALPHGRTEGEVDWEAVRVAYELSGERITAIRERFGLTAHQLRARRTAEGWTAREQIATPPKLPYRKPLGADALELKLNRLVVVGIAMLEKRLADEGLTDQNARMLCELCRAQEIRMRSTRTRTGKARETKKHDGARDFRDDPAWVDAELRRRLERLRTGGKTSSDRGHGDGGGAAGVPR